MEFFRTISFLIMMALLVSCSGSKDLGVDSVETVNVAGTLNLEGSDLQTENYQLFVQNRYSGNYKLIEFQDDLFDFSVTNYTRENFGKNYFIGLIEKSEDNFRFLGPVLFQDDTSFLNYSGFKFDGDVDSLDLSYTPSNSYISVINPTGNVKISYQMLVGFSDGQPLGMPNYGRFKRENSPILSRFNTTDSDEDGVPNLFDTFSNDLSLNNFVKSSGDDNVINHPGLNKLYYVSFIESSVGEVVTTQNVHQFTTFGLILYGDFTGLSAFKVPKIDADFDRAKIAALPNGYSSSNILAPGDSWNTGNSRVLYDVSDTDNNSFKAVFFKSETPVSDFTLAQIDYMSSESRSLLVQLNFVFQGNISLRELSLADIGYLEEDANGDSGNGTSNKPFIISDDRENSAIVLNLPNDLQGQSFTSLSGQDIFENTNAFDYSVVFSVLDESDNELSSTLSRIPSGEFVLSFFTSEQQIVKEFNLNYDAIDVENAAKVKVSLQLASESGDRLTLHYFIKRKSW